MEKLSSILTAFGINDLSFQCEQIKTGHINDTYKIYSNNELYILQKINMNVFKCPEKVMHNIDTAQFFMKEGMEADGKNSFGKIPIYLKSGNKNYYIKNGFWRIYHYIDGTSADKNSNRVYEFGKLLGEFHRHTQFTDISKLYITIPDFHNIEKNILSTLKYEKIIPDTADFFIRFLEFYRNEKNVLSPLRLVHNDVKWENVLTNPKTLIPEALIDLDTVMAGYAAFDFGDAVRSACAAPDETIDLERLYEFSNGYFSEYNELNYNECCLGIISITTELSARYLHDCLNQENYFKNLSYEEKTIKYQALLRFSKNIFTNIEKIKTTIKSAKN